MGSCFDFSHSLWSCMMCCSLLTIGSLQLGNLCTGRYQTGHMPSCHPDGNNHFCQRVGCNPAQTAQCVGSPGCCKGPLLTPPSSFTWIFSFFVMVPACAPVGCICIGIFLLCSICVCLCWILWDFCQTSFLVCPDAEEQQPYAPTFQSSPRLMSWIHRIV